MPLFQKCRPPPAWLPRRRRVRLLDEPRHLESGRRDRQRGADAGRSRRRSRPGRRDGEGDQLAGRGDRRRTSNAHARAPADRGRDDRRGNPERRVGIELLADNSAASADRRRGTAPDRLQQGAVDGRGRDRRIGELARWTRKSLQPRGADREATRWAGRVWRIQPPRRLLQQALVAQTSLARCLGMVSRLTGQSLVPMPPAGRMTGETSA